MCTRKTGVISEADWLGAKRAHSLLTSHSANRKPPNLRLGCNMYFFLMHKMYFVKTGIFKDSVGSVGLNTVVNDSGNHSTIDSYNPLCMLLLKNSLTLPHCTEPLDVLAYWQFKHSSLTWTVRNTGLDQLSLSVFKKTVINKSPNAAATPF